MDPRARAVYRVDVRSFFDTDADGLGDINGVAAKIDYIKELGADTLMLSHVFSGEGFMIDPEIGTARWMCPTPTGRRQMILTRL